jgi:lipoate-protein ligase A
VETLTCRLLPCAVADGPHNMAADEVMLHAAAAGLASLRFYGWAEPTLSLGYFQPERLRHDDPLLEPLPFVRRPSGGATLVHHHEVTYALALPPGPAGTTGHPWLKRMHEIIAAALADLGVEARLHQRTPGQAFPGFLCFGHFADGDLIVSRSKVVGSAQRRRGGALLQHGAILLAQSLHTPSLPGILELTGQRLEAQAVIDSVLTQLKRVTGWEVAPGEFTRQEHEQVAALAAGKYASEAWNRKR